MAIAATTRPRPRIDAAFSRVRRQWFIPDVIWEHGESGHVPVDRRTNPSQWAALVDSDQPVVTQVNDGHNTLGDGQATSSSTAPPVMAYMLQACDLLPGDRVLEIGTGTGFNAALLATLIGAHRVTTVDIDPGLVEVANATLQRHGFGAVHAAVADGVGGYASRAPYDLVLATCQVATVPHAWVEQTTAGGRIVTPFGNHYYNGALVVLSTMEGDAASGYFTDDTPNFMSMRSQRHWFGSIDTYDALNGWRESFCDQYPYALLNDHNSAFALSLQLPDVHTHVVPDDDGDPYHFQAWWIHQSSRSVAVLEASRDVDEFRLRQRGPRSLFDEALAVLGWWREMGEPRRTQFGVTRTAAEQTIWLEHGGARMRVPQR